jgi:Restriction endonuclease S subunits
MNDWRPMRIAEIASPLPNSLATGPFGSAISAKHFVETGVPVLRGSNLSLDVGVRLRDEGLAFLAPDKAKEFQRSVARQGDLVFTCWGTVGQIGLVDGMARYGAYVVSNKQMKLTPDPTKVDSLYLYYLLSSPAMIQVVQGQAIGAAVPGFNLGQLREIQVRLPGLHTQRLVASLLGTFDDLIENNRRRVDALGEMAWGIYREWFVHFRYPGHENATLVDSPIGRIPAGWQPTPLVEGAQIVMGQSPKSEFYNADGIGTPFHQGVTDFGTHFPTTRKYCTVSGRSAAEGDILVSVRAPVGRLNIADTDLVIGRGLAAIRALDGRQGLLFAHLRSVFAEEDSMGGGTIFKAIGKEELSQIRVLQVPEQIANSANDVLSAKFDMIRALTFTNRRLAAMRDLLLPKLVTGQIDVSSLYLDALVEDSVA